MSKVAIVGINWGDEGKGRMVDLIANEYDFVVRYQGGNNAGHTVINEHGKFILNLLPSGVFNRQVMNVLGTGMVIDLEHLVGELKRLAAQGFALSPSQLAISDRAIICFPFHREQDVLQEEYLAGKKFGSTRRGIGPVYGDKYMKKGIQVGELLMGRDYLESRILPLVEWKNLTLEGVYGGRPVSGEAMVNWAMQYGEVLRPYICDTSVLLQQAVKEQKNILFEAQLGALRDIEYGIYPYTSSSSPLAAYAPIGAGIPGEKLDRVLGIVKAYSTCVGEGPFVTEDFGPAGDALREAGGEYGAATGRPRRVGPLDLVATKYGVQVQGATELAVTKLDVLSGLPSHKVCVAYEVEGEQTQHFPFPAKLEKAKPVYEEWEGWTENVEDVRRFEDLPKAAQQYIEKMESYLNCRIRYVSVGASREAIIDRG